MPQVWIDCARALPTQVLMSWHNGFVSEVVTGSEHKGHLFHPKSVFVPQKWPTGLSNKWNELCSHLFYYYYCCDSASHNDLWIHQSREAEPHVSPLCLCCRRDGPSIMCSESDCQHITAVLTIRCGGVVKSWALSVTCRLLLQNTSSFQALAFFPFFYFFFKVSVGAMLVDSLGFFLFAKGFIL